MIFVFFYKGLYSFSVVNRGWKFSDKFPAIHTGNNIFLSIKVF